MGCEMLKSLALAAADTVRAVLFTKQWFTHITTGNMAAAGLGSMYAQLSPSRTYEGDNYVLSQQIGRAVVKHWKG